jgi:hypothetical protein
MMDSQEREIFFYLRQERKQFMSEHAIARFAGGRRKFHVAPDWARPALSRMVERGILETDDANCYRLKPIPDPTKAKQWISPQLASILRRSGKNFRALVENTGDEEAYYDKL